MGKKLGWSTSKKKDYVQKKRQLKRILGPQSSQKNPLKNQEVLNDFMEQIQQNLQGVLDRFVLCKCVDALVPHLLSGRIWFWVDDFSNSWLFLESRYWLFPSIKRRKHIFICIYAFVVLLWFIPPNMVHSEYMIYIPRPSSLGALHGSKKGCQFAICLGTKWGTPTGNCWNIPENYLHVFGFEM